MPKRSSETIARNQLLANEKAAGIKFPAAFYLCGIIVQSELSIIVR